MTLIERIQTILDTKKWSWADLARAMTTSEQRLNNWKKRGVPAAQIKNVAVALGVPRYELDSDASGDVHRLTAEQEEILYTWSVLLPDEKEEVKRRAAHNKAVLAMLGGHPPPASSTAPPSGKDTMIYDPVLPERNELGEFGKRQGERRQQQNEIEIERRQNDDRRKK